ncbi:nucleolar protein 56-like [Montipora capricornis]|uniref:nucleolar protein 56-like n=1 Tax=Montipora capricornis TaxID=246305 RepID=UPI0035F15545
MVLYVLYEHASGYAIFKVIGQEEIGVLLPEVQESVSDLSRFGKLVKLAAFSPFKSGTNALDNINCVSEGIIHDDLKTFLEANVPTGKKKKVVLGVADPKLGAAIQESVNISCESGGVVLEVLRGVRFHFEKMIKGLTGPMAAKAQLGLGHSYSRAKVKFNVHRVDNMIIQSISLLDQLDKDINTFSMRIREWYSYHFPELVKIVPDNYMYAKVTKFIKSRKDLTEDMMEGLEEIVMDSAKCKAIYDASRSSMGMDISPFDLINIQAFASRVIALAEYRKSLHSYLISKMNQVAPNLSALIGEQVGARLISHAGSLTNLAKYPASTVQILGAEKALFRALKKKGNTPKYGLIFHSSFIGRASVKNKGRISRYLANKCSIASRIDCFSETQSSVFGQKLHEQIEERLKFYDTNETPRKNIEVMKEAILEFEENSGMTNGDVSEKKKKKKVKKKKETEQAVKQDEEEERPTVNDSVLVENAHEEESSKKKKKKKKEDKGEKRKAEEEEQEEEEEEEGGGLKFYDANETPRKNIEVMKEANLEFEENSGMTNGDGSEKKKKKKTKKEKKEKEQTVEQEEEEEQPTMNDSVLVENDEEESSKKKKKEKKKKDKGEKRKAEEEEQDEEEEEIVQAVASEEPEEPVKKKKKKKRRSEGGE